MFSVNEVTEKVQIRYDYIKYMIEAVYLIVSGIVIAWGFKGLDEDKIRDSVQKRLEKDWEKHEI